MRRQGNVVCIRETKLEGLTGNFLQSVEISSCNWTSWLNCTAKFSICKWGICWKAIWWWSDFVFQQKSNSRCLGLWQSLCSWYWYAGENNIMIMFLWFFLILLSQKNYLTAYKLFKISNLIIQDWILEAVSSTFP